MRTTKFPNEGSCHADGSASNTVPSVFRNNDVISYYVSLLCMILNSQYSRARVAFHFPQQVKEQVITLPYEHFMCLSYSSRVSRFHR